jgi:uncharacterized membrane protein
MSIIGLCLTSGAAVPFMNWYLKNLDRLQPASPDEALQCLQELWIHSRWMFASLAVALLALVWALVTSVQIIRSTSKPGAAPPVLPT